MHIVLLVLCPCAGFRPKRIMVEDCIYHEIYSFCVGGQLSPVAYARDTSRALKSESEDLSPSSGEDTSVVLWQSPTSVGLGAFVENPLQR